MLTKEFVRPLCPAFKYSQKTWQNPTDDTDMRFDVLKTLAQIEFDKGNHKAEHIQKAINNALIFEKAVYELSPTKEEYKNKKNIENKAKKAMEKHSMLWINSVVEIFGPPDDGSLCDVDIFMELKFAHYCILRLHQVVPESILKYRGFYNHAKICKRKCPGGCNVRGCKPRIMELIDGYTPEAMKAKNSVYHPWYIARFIEQGLLRNHRAESQRDKQYSLRMLKLIIRYFINVPCGKSIEKAKSYAKYIFKDFDNKFLEAQFIELVDEIAATMNEPLNLIVDKVTCSICLTENIERAGNPDGCKHVFCHECINEYTEFQINQNKNKRRRCPLCRNSYFCLHEVDVKTLNIINSEYKN